VMGLTDFAELPVDEAVANLVAANRRLVRYQRKWLRRLDAVTLDSGRPAAAVARDVLALARERGMLPA
jgi:tRNA A37 N6-isopentenylltransferase MiaA